MSMNRYAGSGPIMAGLAFGEWVQKPESKTAPAGDTNVVSAYPDLPASELKRMIENLADQVSELAAANVELRQRIMAVEAHLVVTASWTPWGAGIDRFNVSFD